MATVKTLIVAGGGAGGNGNSGSSNGGGGGGGGAGGYIYNASTTLTATSYLVTVGGGGNYGGNGQNSSFSSYTAIGGGRGGNFAGVGLDGGSGGGGAASFNGGLPDMAGGSATASQGNNGGHGHGLTAGGGGGAAAVGVNANGTLSGAGGAGILNPLTSSGYICGGGGGGAGTGNTSEGAGGNGGGGAGGYLFNTTLYDGVSGTANTGGGGGGTSGATALTGLGGSGIVQIAYHTDGSDGILPTSTGGTITTLGALTLHTFTFSGTFTPVYTPLYWVGGTGTWDNSDATHWAITSGGTGGTIAPVSANPVLIDGNSGSGTITLTTGVAYSINFTGYTGTFAGSSALSLNGSLTLGSGMTNSYTGDITLAGVGTLTTNGITLAGALNLSGVYTLADDVILSGLSWNCTGSLTSGTSTIKMTNATSSGKTFAGGGQTYNNLWITGSGTGAYTIQGSNTFNDFKCDTPPHTINFNAGTTQTVQSFTVNGTSGNFMTLQSTSSGTQWKLACPNLVSCDYLSLQDSKAEKI